MARPGEPGAAAPFLGVGGALVLLGAATTTWLERAVPRVVGDVAVTATEVTVGTDISPLMVVAALAALVCSVALLLTRHGARRIVALLLVVTGVWAVGSVAVGVSRARVLDGVQTAAPWIALLGAAGVLGAGLLAFGRPGRRLPARYDVGAPPEDTEWRMASGADDTAGDNGARGRSDMTRYAERRPGDAVDGGGDAR